MKVYGIVLKNDNSVKGLLKSNNSVINILKCCVVLQLQDKR